MQIKDVWIVELWMLKREETSANSLRSSIWWSLLQLKTLWGKRRALLVLPEHLLVSSKWQIGKILIFWIDRDGLVVGVTIYYAGLSLLIGFWDLWTFIKETYQTRIEWVMTHFVDILGKLSSSAQLLRATINLCYWYNKKSKTVKIMEHRVAEVFQTLCEGHFAFDERLPTSATRWNMSQSMAFDKEIWYTVWFGLRALWMWGHKCPQNLLMKESPG